MDLLYKDLTDKIIKAVYAVYNTLGYGYHEKEYQKALSAEFVVVGLGFKRELYSNLKYHDVIIRKYFVDFLVEGKVVVELKVANGIYKQHFTQILQYLTNHQLSLGLIIAITPSGLVIKRVIASKQ